MMNQRCLLQVSGIVQGVGFRPFIYQLATRLELSGWVLNDSDGVTIDIQGLKDKLHQFIQHLTEQAPPLARIDNVIHRDLPLINRQGFEIRHSDGNASATVSISPDKAICADCLVDLRNPDSRFYHYPFTNCTNCGPRYTIIQQLPYDRCHTSMQKFKLCPACETAYRDPMNRRYHAQPISCELCGPLVRLLSGDEHFIAEEEHAIRETAQLITSGCIVAVKGLGGFHLVCDATNTKAVTRLREIKYRQRKPFAVMVSHEEVAKQYVTGDLKEWQALNSSAAPIVLMCRLDDSLISPVVAPDAPYLGVMLPYTPLHALLFDELQRINGPLSLVVTSANRSGVPMAINREEVFAQFGDDLDAVLDHSRDIVNPIDDSVVHYAGGKIRILRLARGYAPQSYAMPHQDQCVMAVGAQQKASVAYAIPGQWMVSPYIGDLTSIDMEQRYELAMHAFTRLYQAEPTLWIHDHHPGYFSTRYAKQYASCIGVQHHYAHVLAVMAEYGLDKPVLGFTFDGTGWGDDDTVWGGEVLKASLHGYERIGHLRSFKLIGGEKAIKEPARLLLAMLLEIYPLETIKALNLDAFNQWSDRYLQNLYQLWLSGSHSPYCSSVGRLFDAWALLLTLLKDVDFEGESGLMIERAAMKCPHLSMELSMRWDRNNVLDWAPALKQTLSCRVDCGEQWPQVMSRALLAALISAVVTMAGRHPDLPIVVGGGVFQNRVLMDGVTDALVSHPAGFFAGSQLPANDGGISTGQLWFGLHQTVIKH